MPAKKRKKVYRWKYFQIYLLDHIPPRLYGTEKAHEM